MYEMYQFNKKTVRSEQQLLNIAQVPIKILPNVMSLLGEPVQDKIKSSYQPIFGIFYMSPVSTTTLIFNLVYMFVFYIIQLQISFSIAFGPSFLNRQNSLKAYEFGYWLIITFLALDIFLNFHKGYYAFGKGRIIDDQRKIIRNYLIYQFPFDIISVFFFIIPRFNDDYFVNFLQIIPGVLFWIKKFKYQAEIINILQYKRTPRIIFLLVILFIDVLMIGNYGACLFVGLDLLLWKLQYYGNNSAYYWLSNNSSYSIDLIGGPWYIQYIYAQSFSTGTLSTLAPGPFAKNPIQVIYAIFVMVYFMLLASYVGQILISILYNQQQKRIFHEENIQSFDKFMRLKQIPQAIKTRIHNFFELIWQVQIKMQTEQQNQVINRLPQALKQQLLIQMSFVKSLYMLKYFQNYKFLQKQIALKITRVIIDSNTCVFKQFMTLDSINGQKKKQQFFQQPAFIYYIRSGMAKFYFSSKNYNEYQFLSSQKSNNSNQTIIAMSNIEKAIGLYEFLTKQAYSYCCTAVDLCQIDKLSRKDFDQILEITQNNEKYKKLIYEVLIQKQLHKINKVCLICMQYHVQKQCPEINTSISIINILKQNHYSLNQPRKSKYQRKEIKSLKKKEKKKKQVEDDKKKSVFDNLFKAMNKKGISLQKLILNVARIQKLQQIQFYQDFYPQFNMEIVNSE